MGEKKEGQTGGELPQAAQEALKVVSSPKFKKAIAAKMEEALQEVAKRGESQEAPAEFVKFYIETIRNAAQEAGSTMGVSEPINPIITATAKLAYKILQQWAKQIKQADKEIAAITVKRRLDKLDFPLDKVNSKMWNLLETDTGAQLRFAVEKAGSKKQLNVIYSIDFDGAEQAGLRISKKLDAFDKRVYIAAASLYAYRVDVMTIGQIYNAMGYDGTPGATDREKINDSLSKMQMAHIYIDNKEEASAYKGYEHFRYDGYLLPLERVSRIVNGVAVDGVIHLLKEPPMYTFAKNRRQITTIQRNVLQTPLSKTNTNLLLEDYLIERIARAKNGNGQKKILYKTIYDNAGITSAKQRQRAKDKITQLLNYYQSTGYIQGYKTGTDGVIVDP